MITRYKFVHRTVLAIILAAFVGSSGLEAQAQEPFKFSGQVFADYFYNVSSFDDSDEGENAFSYRRARFTADKKFDDQFSVRFRIEANDGTTNAKGDPTPFVKDLYVRWNDALASGHRIVIGVSSPPAWQPAEKTWGFRSVSKTLQDRTKVHSSRDLGITFSGPLAQDGRLRYGLMVANGNSIRKEDDKYKRVYGQLEYDVANNLIVTFGGNYEQLSDGYAYNLNGFIGYTGEEFRLGAEGYLHPTEFDENILPDENTAGSVFAVYDLSPTTSFLVRVDHLDRTGEDNPSNETYIVVGIALSPNANVQFIPNVIFVSNDGESEDRITGRVTLAVKM